MSREQERNRLVELMKQLDGNFKRTCPAYNDPNIGFEELGNCTGCKYQTGKDDCDYIARATDYLLDNGVIIPPVKVGDTVWDNDFGYSKSYTVTGFDIGKTMDDDVEHRELFVYYQNWNGSITCSAPLSIFGKTVFLTKEDAEAAFNN